MNEPLPPVDSRVADLTRAGVLRTGLFLPQFVTNAATGALDGRGTGRMAQEISALVAARLGITALTIGHDTPALAADALASGACDIAFMGIEPARAARFDFTRPIFQFDYTLLVPPASSIRRFADVDQADFRVAVSHGHASTLALIATIKHARLIEAKLPTDALALLRDGAVEAFAFPRDVLMGFAEQWAGARVLDDAYGENNVAIAVAKGRDGWISYFNDIILEAKTSGFVRRVTDEAPLRGFRVAPV